MGKRLHIFFQLKYPDGTKATIQPEQINIDRPDGSKTVSITQKDGSKIEYEDDGKGNTVRTYYDKENNPLLKEQATKEKVD